MATRLRRVIAWAALVVIALGPCAAQAQEAPAPEPPIELGPPPDPDVQPDPAPDQGVQPGEPPGGQLPEPPLPDPAAPEDEDEEYELVALPSYWGGPRWHVAGTVDLGFLFLRPQFLFGYGTPQETYVALEADPLISGQGVGAYGGLRGQIPWGELRLGARYFFTFTRSFLFAADDFTHLQVRDRSGPPSRYLSLEAQIGFDIPIGAVSIVSEVTATYVTLVDEGLFAYEETLRVVLDPPFVWGAVLGVRVRFGENEEFYIEPQVEVVHLVEREDFVVRVGFRAGVRLWEDLEVRLVAMPALVSPDSLGAAGGDTFLLGIRYRWATDVPGDPPEAIVEP